MEVTAQSNHQPTTGVIRATTAYPANPRMMPTAAANGPKCSAMRRKMTTTNRAFVTATILLLLALLCPWTASAQGTVMPYPNFLWVDTNGNPCNACTLDTWAAGTTTNQATYSDSALTTANANPVVLNSAGYATVYLSATSYRMRLRTSAGVTIWDRDNITAVPTSSGNTDITTAVAGVALAAGDLVYLSDGSNSLTAGRWYLADADFYYASVHPVLGFATAAIASAATGTVRLAGIITGLSGLTAGTTYYVSATAAGVTATAPANARAVGQALSTTSLAINIASAWILDAGQALKPMDGRLTLTTAVPITTADVTAAGTLYYTPYAGNRVSLFDGSRWKAYSFSELSLTITCTSGSMYDVWLYDNAGTLTLETLVWTNTTTRATALALQNGVLSRTGSLTRRYTGSFYCTATNQTEDSFARRMLWNYDNRVPRPMRVLEATDEWTYTLATLRQANAATGNQLDFVIGVSEVPVDASVQAMARNSGGGILTLVAIGLDSTTAAATGCIMQRYATPGADTTGPVSATLRTFPGIGRHTAVWLEYSSATGTTTWSGDSGAPTLSQAGITGLIEG